MCKSWLLGISNNRYEFNTTRFVCRYMHWYVTIFKNCPEFPRTDVTLQNQIWTQIYVLAGDNLQKLFGFCSYIRVYPDRVKKVPIYKLCVAFTPPLFSVSEGQIAMCVTWQSVFDIWSSNGRFKREKLGDLCGEAGKVIHLPPEAPVERQVSASCWLTWILHKINSRSWTTSRWTGNG